MSVGESRLIAEQMLRGQDSPPVKLSKVLRRAGLRLKRQKLDRHVSSVLLQGKSPVIVVNQRLKRNLRRFSTAHSLGHFLLHQGGAKVFVTDLTVHMRAGPTLPTDPREVEANGFAFDLLVPERMLRADLGTSGGLDLSNDAGVRLLADKYRVSVGVFTAQAIRLGLVWGIAT